MDLQPVALIPLRAGTKGLPGKNVRMLAGKPLYAHTVDQARAAGIQKIIISTDIRELIEADLGRDVRVDTRPAVLAADITPMAEVLHHALADDVFNSATVVLLQATSPLREPSDIRHCIDLHSKKRFDVVMTVTRAESSVLKWGRADGDHFLPLSDPIHCFSNRDQLPPVYRPSGAVYVFNASWFRRTGTLAAGDIGIVETAPERSHDIDTLADFDAVESLMAKRNT